MTVTQKAECGEQFEVLGLTRHKISDREPGKERRPAEVRMANIQKPERRLACGSLHRLVRSLGSIHLRVLRPFSFLPVGLATSRRDTARR